MKKTISLAGRDTCTGCSACYSVCPRNAIKMTEDNEGFLHPKIISKLCVECHSCEKVCPVLNRIDLEKNENISVLAAFNTNEIIRSESSSGGIFYSLACSIIRQGGLVFGARWNNEWNVVHDFSESIFGIKPFMGSKYVQSCIGDTYKLAKEFLERGRKVLFTGTPCQIAGLKHFLNKEYDTLLAVELLCMGVPNAKIWRKFLEEYTNKNGISKVDTVSFKNKSQGWLHSSFAVSGSDKDGIKLNIVIPSKKSSYYVGFDKCVFLRRSCYHCRFRVLDTFADITIGDCWNVKETCPDLFDDKGISTIICRTDRGRKALDSIIDELILRVEDSSIIAERIGPPIEKRLMKGYQRRRDFFFYNIFFGFDSWIIQSVFHNDKPLVRVVRKLKSFLSNTNSL